MTGRTDYPTVRPIAAYPGYGWDAMGMGFVRLPQELTPSQEPLRRVDWDEYFFRIAKEVSTRATCPRASIGVVLVDGHHRIVATGYNGSPSGQEHCTEAGCSIYAGHCVRALHAERNAVQSAYGVVHTLQGGKDNYRWVDGPFLKPFDITPYIYGPRDVCSACAGSMYRAGIRNEPKLRRAVGPSVEVRT